MNLKQQEAYVLKTHITKYRLLALTGIFGIEPDFIPNATNLLIKRSKNRPALFKIRIKTKRIRVLKVEIDFVKHTIFIDLIRGYKKETGILQPLMREMVANARLCGFLYIRLWAFGNYQVYKYWQGYLIWGKYGFLMEPHYREAFLTSMINQGRSEQWLYDLLKNVDGYEFWKLHGDEWWGRFFLYHSSDSRQILAEAIGRARARRYKN